MVFTDIGTDSRECNLRNHVNRESCIRLAYYARRQWLAHAGLILGFARLPLNDHSATTQLPHHGAMGALWLAPPTNKQSAVTA